MRRPVIYAIQDVTRPHSRHLLHRDSLFVIVTLSTINIALFQENNQSRLNMDSPLLQVFFLLMLYYRFYF